MIQSKVACQVKGNRLISIVEDQAQALLRTAFSTSVREAGDLSAGVYDATGAILAQAVTGTPGHVNAMAAAVPHVIARIGRDTMAGGDVYLTNDPWEGTGPLHDFTVVTPSFHRGAVGRQTQRRRAAVLIFNSGGAGARDPAMVRRDLALGCISAMAAQNHYGLSAGDCADGMRRTDWEEVF